MSKWVTFHESIIGGVSDLKVHANQEEATAYFKANYRSYFELSQKVEVKLPMRYGYAHRAFIGMSLPKFRKVYGEVAD